MKLKLILLLILLLPYLGPAPAAAQGEKLRYKLGLIIGDKDEDRRESAQERKTKLEVLNAANTAFLSARRFDLVERSQLGAVFTEKSLQDFIGGQVNNKLTDVLSLDLVGVVAYVVEGKKWIVEVRLIDVKTASVLSTVTSDRASLSSMLPPATAREAGTLLAQSIREAFPPLGYIVQIKDNEIVVDIGAEVGLKAKDTLEVVKEGEQIIHPVTGQVLASPMAVVSELKVISVSPQVAICKRSGKKTDLQVANLVRLKGTESVVFKWLQKVPRVSKGLGVGVGGR